MWGGRGVRGVFKRITASRKDIGGGRQGSDVKRLIRFFPPLSSFFAQHQGGFSDLIPTVILLLSSWISLNLFQLGARGKVQPIPSSDRHRGAARTTNARQICGFSSRWTGLAFFCFLLKEKKENVTEKLFQ